MTSYLKILLIILKNHLIVANLLVIEPHIPDMRCMVPFYLCKVCRVCGMCRNFCICIMWSFFISA